MTGSQLRKIRKRADLTGPELAGKIKVSPNTVYRWERGEVRITDQVAAHIHLLAETLFRRTNP